MSKKTAANTPFLATAKRKLSIKDYKAVCELVNSGGSADAMQYLFGIMPLKDAWTLALEGYWAGDFNHQWQWAVFLASDAFIKGNFVYPSHVVKQHDMLRVKRMARNLFLSGRWNGKDKLHIISVISAYAEPQESDYFIEGAK